VSFIKYPHLEKYGNNEVQDIEFGICHIFPKLDGTNASVWFNERVRAGSRNRELDTVTFQNDNAGFAAWVGTDSNGPAGFIMQNPHLRLFGEWLVPHTVKHYRPDLWRRFWIFDVWDNNSERMLTYDEYQPLLDSAGLDYIPCIKIIKNPSYENLMHEAINCRYGLVDVTVNDKPGEGIVIKNYNWKNKFGHQPWAKIVNGEFKDDFYAKMGANVLENRTGAQAVADIACTPHLIDKEYAKIVNAEGEWQRKYIPRLLHTVYYSVVTEELWNCLKKINRATVNFQELQKHCELKVKEHRKDLF
jgi:hypothetical protein